MLHNHLYSDNRCRFYTFKPCHMKLPYQSLSFRLRLQVHNEPTIQGKLSWRSEKQKNQNSVTIPSESQQTYNGTDLIFTTLKPLSIFCTSETRVLPGTPAIETVSKGNAPADGPSPNSGLAIAWFDRESYIGSAMT